MDTTHMYTTMCYLNHIRNPTGRKDVLMCDLENLRKIMYVPILAGGVEWCSAIYM